MYLAHFCIKLETASSDVSASAGDISWLAYSASGELLEDSSLALTYFSSSVHKEVCGKERIAHIVVQNTNTDGWGGHLYKKVGNDYELVLPPSGTGLLWVDGNDDTGDKSDNTMFLCHNKEKCLIRT